MGSLTFAMWRHCGLSSVLIWLLNSSTDALRAHPARNAFGEGLESSQVPGENVRAAKKTILLAVSRINRNKPVSGGLTVMCNHC